MNTFRYLAAAAPLAGVMAAAPLLAASGAPAWTLLMWTTVVAYLAIEAAAVVLGHSDPRPGDSRLGRAVFWTVWPGIDAAPLRTRARIEVRTQKRADLVAGRLLRAGAGRMSLGLLACAVVALGAAAGMPADVIGWAGIAALLLTVHLGLTDVIAGVVRRCGFAVSRPFSDPLLSRSLREFWNVRWNHPFVEMNRLLLTGPLRRIAGPRAAVFAAFVVSGLLHEMAISFPVQEGWGGPAAYFLLHGALVVAEPRLRVGHWPALAARLWTWAWLLLPLPLLFHAPFRDGLVVPLFTTLGGLLMSLPLMWSPAVHSPLLVQAFSVALYLGALGHLILAAIAPQVPRQLRWREELAVLSPINRNLFWTYGGYIAATNLAFGLYTFFLHDDLLAGVPAALAVAGFIGVYWLVRLLLDFFVLPFAAWPRNPGMWLAHLALAGLFCCLTATYLGLVVWHGLA